MGRLVRCGIDILNEIAISLSTDSLICLQFSLPRSQAWPNINQVRVQCESCNSGNQLYGDENLSEISIKSTRFFFLVSNPISHHSHAGNPTSFPGILGMRLLENCFEVNQVQVQQMKIFLNCLAMQLIVRAETDFLIYH